MATTMKTDMTVANEILRQLGGRRFIVMTGARDFTGTANTLTFRIARYFVRITLTALDLYDVELISIRTLKVTKSENGIYNDMLQAAFTRLTGLDTHL